MGHSGLEPNPHWKHGFVFIGLVGGGCQDHPSGD